ncbi:MAG: hypothetical protein JJE01_09535 [Gemmatimonadetes bacterium]|nr:hypothetical protein [Gemmatimonadota bacterium]
MSDGKTLAQAYRESEVLNRRDTDTEVVLTTRATRALIGAWEQQPGIEVRVRKKT